MQAISTLNKTALIAPIAGTLLFAIGAFISTCVYISHGAIEQVKHSGVGGRIGFVLILFSLLNLAFWAFAGFKVFKNSWDGESYTLVKVSGIFMIFLSFITCLIVHGQAIQIIQLTKDFVSVSIEFEGSFVGGADATVALLSLSMVCALCFLFFFIFWRAQIVGSNNTAPPQQPGDMYVQQQDQTSYYAQPVQGDYPQQQQQSGGYSQPQADYAPPQGSGVYA